MKKVVTIGLALIFLVSLAAFLPRIVGSLREAAPAVAAEVPSGALPPAADGGDRAALMAANSVNDPAGTNAPIGLNAPTGANSPAGSYAQGGTNTSGGTNPAGSAFAAPESLYLHIGSPIALSNGEILPIDSDNPGFTPIIHNGRTLVPLRFVSEFYNADVRYDAQNQTGIVEIGGKTAEFPVGRDYYMLDGARLPLDVETLNVDGHIMLPLRALCEKVLGLSVDYSDSVIYIAGTASLDETTVTEVRSKIGAYVKVSDLAALTEYFSKAAVDMYSYVAIGEFIEDADVSFEMEMESAALSQPGAAAGPGPSESPPSMSLPAPSATPSSAPSSAPSPEARPDSPDHDEDLQQNDLDGGYSSTNTQVAGVDEGDIIKTDGRYIFLSCYDSIRIVDTLGNMSLVARIDIPSYNLVDIYIDAGRLIAISNDYYSFNRAMPEAGGKIVVDSRRCVEVSVYDTSDMSDIKLLREYRIEGNLATTRKQGGYLYLLTTQYLWDSPTFATDPRPMAGEGDAFKPLPISDIMIAPGCPANSLLTLTAINVIDAEEKIASETITINGYSNTQYMSNNAMYIAADDYFYFGGNSLSISKFTIRGGKIGYAGSGSVRGSANNQFSLDEYNGYLRVATTEWDMMNKNNLFVLDSNMQVCGSVEGFAPEERVYSARFMGDRGYIVTFRQVDPLFVFDLSDPTNPKITGELKVPGFSTYLHPIAENVVLGIGRDVYDIFTRDRYGNEVVIGQNTGGIKLSLFDVSDMGKPREIDTLVLGDSGYAELLDNHKAAMFKADDAILAFCADIMDDTPGDGWWNGAFIISYADNSLSEIGRIKSAPVSGSYYTYSFNGQRLVYIGGTLYYADSSVLRSFDLYTLAEKQTLALR